MMARRFIMVALTVCAAVTAVLASTAATSFGIETHLYIPELQINSGVASTGAGFSPIGVAIDNYCWFHGYTNSTTPTCASVDSSSGDARVDDAGSLEIIERFAPLSNLQTYVCQITGTATPSASECNSSGSDTTVGSLKLPYGDAVDERTGEIYVANRNNHVVDVFGSDGEFRHEFDGSATPAGSFIPSAIALDRLGDIYVVDVTHKVVDKYSSPSSSSYVCQITGQGSGSTSTTECNGGHGPSVPSGAFSKAFSVAVDNSTSVSDPSAGDIYVGDNSNDVVDKFNSIGEYIPGSQLTGPSALVPFCNKPTTKECLAGVAVDQSTHHLYVADKKENHVVDEFAASGALVSQFAPPTGTFEPFFVAIDQATGDVYASDTVNRVVDVFGPLVETLTAITGPAKEDQATSLTLTGEINPEHVDASGFFEYGPTNTFGSNATGVMEGTQTTDLGKGNTFVKVESKLSGLEPNKAYHYRLVGHNAFGNFPASNEETVKTLAIPPTMGEIGSAFGTPREAELIGNVNPNNDPTSYEFAYCAGSSLATCAETRSKTAPASAGSGYGNVEVFQHITGLKPETTYHFQLIAENGQAPASKSAEVTFTTPSEPQETRITPKAPIVTTGPVIGVTNESATISGSVDPERAPTSFAFEVGVYEGVDGAQTHFVVAASGEAGEGAAAVGETAQLTGLQPGVKYALRIRATNEKGPASGRIVTFETSPAPTSSLIVQPPGQTFLATPAISWPTAQKGAAKPSTTEQKALAKCKGKKHRKQRRACERSVRKRLGKKK